MCKKLIYVIYNLYIIIIIIIIIIGLKMGCQTGGNITINK
jgi:hypothetical protein